MGIRKMLPHDVGQGVRRRRGIEFAGISGWDPKGKQLVEHWHATDGLYVTIRYPLSEMKEQLWSGTLTVTFGDVRRISAHSRWRRQKMVLFLTARTTLEGKETVRKSIAPRIERESVEKQ